MEKKTIIHIGETLKSFKFGWIVGFISPFSLALFAWALKASNIIFRDALILTTTFIVGTVILSLVIKVGTLAIGNVLIWLGEYKQVKKKANLKFDTISEGNQRFYFSVQNKEYWTNVDEVKVFWDDIVSTPGIPNEPFRELRNWRVNRKALEWRFEKTDIAVIPKRKSKTAYFFEIHEEQNMFSIRAKGCEPIYFPVGEYIFFLSVVGKVPKKIAEYQVRIEFEYKGGSQYKIGNATIW